MMTVSLRAAHPSQLRVSLAAVRSCLVLMLLALFGTSAFGQGLSPGGPVNFGTVLLGNTATTTLTFTAPLGGTDITSVAVVTEGATGKDFTLKSDVGCIGMLNFLEKCTIVLDFTPSQIGTRLGALTITDSANVVVNTVYLAGVGVGPQFVFAPATATTTSTSSTIAPANFKPGAAVEDGNGNLFFTDILNNRILERSSTGVYSVVNTTLTVTATSGITIDGTGTLYVSSGSSVFGFMPGSTPTAVPTPGITLTTPTGLAVDEAGDLYIADSSNNKVYQIPLGTNTGTTLALTGPGAALVGPTGLAIDTNNNLYIADSGNNRIVKVPITTLVTTIVPLTSILLSNPTGVTVDAAGTVYIANTGDSNIVEATVTGAQFILSETPNPLPLATPSGIVIQSDGDLTVTDTTNGLVDIARSTPAINFPTPTVVGTLDATDDPEDLTVQDSGNITSTLTASTQGDPSISTTAFQLGTANTTPCPVLAPGGIANPSDIFNPGEVCIYAIDFKPTVVGLNSANLVLVTTATAGALTTSNTVPLTGIGLSTAQSFRLVALSVPPTTPTTIDKGGSVELVLTALNADGTTVATDYVGTVFFTTSAGTSGAYLGGTTPGADTSTYTMTAADNGVLTIPVAAGLQLNQFGTFTATATADPATLAPGSNNVAVSNPIFVIEPATVALTSSINPSLVNQTTVFTLTVTTTGGVTPTGTVTFFSNGVQIGAPVTLTPGATASIPDSFAAPGNYAITATYTPTSTTQGGTASLTQVVGLPSAVVLTSSINPSLVNQSTNLTATISAIASPTGSVTFFSGATALGTVPVTVTGNTGTATFPASFTPAGTYLLKAVYNTTSTNPDVANATSNIVTQVVLNPSTITLTSSINPSQVNQSTTFTLTVASAGVAPTGSVTFFSNGVAIGTSTVTGGAASLPHAFTAIGTFAITATYTGDTLTKGGSAGPLSQVVVNTTTITLTSSINPSLVNQSTNLTATISALGTPTGTVKFFDGATLLGTVTLNGTTAVLPFAFTTVGTHPLTAVYSGDTHTNGATSAILDQVVVNAATITLTSSVNPSLVNQSTTLTADLTALGTPTGTVKFFDGATLLGTVNVTAGIATLPVSFTTPGTHPLKAVYSGDTNTQPATSAILNQIVLYPSTVTLTTSVNPVLVNANTTLTSTVTSTGTLTGTVTFYAGTTKLGTSTLTGGVATLVVSFPTAGVYSLTAVYSGDTDNQTATSPPVSQTVLNIATVALTSSINPVFLNNPTVLTALLTSTGATPTGTVSFFDGSTPLGTATLVNGIASISATFVYAGTHTITALYSGDAVTAPASAPALSQIVADFSLTVASGASSTGSTIAGGTVTYSLVLTPIITTTLPSAVTLTFSGLPSTVTGFLNPVTVPAGSGTTPIAFSVTAAQIVAALHHQQMPPHHSPARYAPVALALLALPLAWFRRRKRIGSLLASVCLLLAITGGLTGCISDPASGYYGQTPKTYNLTVTATSGNLSRSTYLTLTVQ
jgi:sugar lactone lactonase YvrE